MNCWEYMNCGREPGGYRVPELGVCPAATFKIADGFCGGKNGGRACVLITGTLCKGEIQGTERDKHKDCTKCGFYKELVKEHPNMINEIEFVRFLIKSIDETNGMKKDVEHLKTLFKDKDYEQAKGMG